MRRTLNIMGLAEASAKAAQRAGRGRTLSARGQMMMRSKKDLIVLCGRHMWL